MSAQSSLASLQASATTLSGNVDALQSANQSSINAATVNLEVKVSTRASQTSFDNLTTNSLVTLTSNVLIRASQTSVNKMQSDITLRLDTNVLSRR